MPTILTPHFTLEEMTVTQVRGVDNTPDARVRENLKRLCTSLMEPIRVRWGSIQVNSGYRSKAINAVIGGSGTSKHMDGLACDFVPKKAALLTVMRWVVEESDLPYDQMIFEFGRWLHIGIAPGTGKPRKQALMIFEQNKYLAFDTTKLPKGTDWALV
jgi:zinc D-Ala-D-Ala carboxypeptidase